MIWFLFLGLVALLLVTAGTVLTAKRISRYQREAETRRTKALAEILKIGEKKKTERDKSD